MGIDKHNLCGYRRRMDADDPFGSLFVLPLVTNHEEARLEVQQLYRSIEHHLVGEAIATPDLVDGFQQYLHLIGYARHLSVREFIFMSSIISNTIHIQTIEEHIEKLAGRWIHPPFP